jgi:WhiB family redox-sensing transcriptional regulator
MTEYAPGGWRAAGACLSADPDLFFPVSPNGKAARQASRALRICAGCRVQRQCLEFALQANEMEGIWGGTTPEERVRARRERAARRRREATPRVA